MWIKLNANPAGKRVGDCVVRAISIATGKPWLKVYDDLHRVGRIEFDMMSSNDVWGLYLYLLGFEPFVLPDACPECITVREFAKHFPIGTYIIGTGSHAVAVINGDWVDTFNSAELVPSYFFVVD